MHFVPYQERFVAVFVACLVGIGLLFSHSSALGVRDIDYSNRKRGCMWPRSVFPYSGLDARCTWQIRSRYGDSLVVEEQLKVPFLEYHRTTSLSTTLEQVRSLYRAMFEIQAHLVVNCVGTTGLTSDRLTVFRGTPRSPGISPPPAAAPSSPPRRSSRRRRFSRPPCRPPQTPPSLPA